jgi:hypothetical protein
MTAVIDRPEARTDPPEASAATRRPTRRGLGPRARSLLWFVPAFALGLVAQIVNLGGSPQRIDDEGTYTAQAWAIEKLGELAHYTFWYDHPPVGWIQIAGWTQLTGAFERHDVSVLAAREFMVVVTMAAAALLWVLARRLRFGRPAAAAAMLLFTLSPLALQFHRSVYLDNIATVWLLAAFVLALSRRRQLAAFIGASAAFGIAVLSKETFLLALPLLAWLMWRNAHPSTRRYTLAVAASVLVLIGGGYILLALVKGELTPGPDRVSLLDGVTFQLGSRESSGSLGDPESLVSKTFGMWWQLDPVGIVAAGVAALGALFVRRLRPFAIALLLLTALLFRPGGYVPVPYVIMLIPFAALLIPGVVQSAVGGIRRRSGHRAGQGGWSVSGGAVRRSTGVFVLIGAVAGAAVVAPLWATQLRGFLLADLDEPMRDAQAWVEQNVPQDSRLIVDDAMWVDLVEAGFERDNVIWYYKLDTDPAVQAQSPNGWRDSDYVITTDSMRTFPNTGDGVNQAIGNSVAVASFGTGNQQVDIRRIDPDGIEQAEADAQQGFADRASAGAQLAANPALELDQESRDLLTGGRVDSRIILALGQLTGSAAGSDGVTVAGFPAVTGETDSARRQVLLESVSGEAERAELVEWFSALGSPVSPTSAVATTDGVLVTFPVGEPEGLLPRVEQ